MFWQVKDVLYDVIKANVLLSQYVYLSMFFGNVPDVADTACNVTITVITDRRTIKNLFLVLNIMF